MLTVVTRSYLTCKNAPLFILSMYVPTADTGFLTNLNYPMYKPVRNLVSAVDTYRVSHKKLPNFDGPPILHFLIFCHAVFDK